MSGRTIGSLCTGILGLDRAVAEHFGAELAWYSEVEPAACTIIEREHPGVPNLGDLTLVDWSTVPPVDILTAGYPCQPFSHAGKRKGASDARHLWPYIIDAVRVLRPRWVVAENVRGHLSLGFDRVLWSLAEAGFDAEWCVLRASDVGAAHQRARVFLVATDTACHSGRVGNRDGQAPADADRLDDHGGRDVRAGGRTEPADGHRHAPVEWGKYAAAIDRWAGLVGRPAPHPVDEKGRLSPALVEWMMGYPEGWVAELPRTKALKALGNAVVSQQALAALRELCPLGDPVTTEAPTAEKVDLLPTPVVNDMGARKTPAEWDEWTARMKAKHGNGNGHGASLSIEAQRLAGEVSA